MRIVSDFAKGKDNNFNLIRIIAALAVLVTHGFALATGNPLAEPFRDVLGVTMGTIAVDIFFITSGFLVTGSLLSKQAALDFLWARFLRIYPALLVMVLLTVFGLGLYFTTLPAGDYLRSSQTLIYLIKCSTLIKDVAFVLPGVFEDNPYKGAVNGSLWTMPYEIRMYALLILMWLVLRFTGAKRVPLLKMAILAATAAAAVLVFASILRLTPDNRFTKLFFMFFLGASFQILQARIRLLPSVFWTAFALLLISPAFGQAAFTMIYHLTLAYILFYLAYIPAGAIRNYNKLGDYSYGVYIFAFPLQQAIVALTPGISPAALIFISGIATLMLAVLSWHLLEKRALRLKTPYLAYTRRLLATRWAR